MRTRKIIFIDGIKTRAEIKKISGKGGMTELCRRLGVSQPILSDICIHGYGSEKAIKKFKSAGIPIIISDKPVPSRQVKEYTKKKLTAKAEGLVMKAEEIPFGRQLSLETLKPAVHQTEAQVINEIIIRHLTELTEELKTLRR